jgi:hypothetical protein
MMSKELLLQQQQQQLQVDPNPLHYKKETGDDKGEKKIRRSRTGNRMSPLL